MQQQHLSQTLPPSFASFATLLTGVDLASSLNLPVSQGKSEVKSEKDTPISREVVVKQEQREEVGDGAGSTLDNALRKKEKDEEWKSYLVRYVKFLPLLNLYFAMFWCKIHLFEAW